MKLLLCVLVIVVGVTAPTDEQLEKLFEIGEECRKTSKVPLELLAKAQQGDLGDDPKMKKQIFCIAKKVNLVSASGKPNIPNLKKRLKAVSKNDKEVDKLVKKCNKKKKTPTETAFHIYKCVLKDKKDFSPV